VKTIAVFGGVPLNQQMVTLKNTEILVATPGRLLDLVSTQSINLARIETLVLDEADKMLDLGFKEEANNIFKLLPKKRQNILFSATLDTDLETIKEALLSEPVKIEIEPEVQNLDQINQIAYAVSPERKGPFLRYLIKTQAMQQVLIFVSAVRTADNLVDKLKKMASMPPPFTAKNTRSKNRSFKKFQSRENQCFGSYRFGFSWY